MALITLSTERITVDDTAGGVRLTATELVGRSDGRTVQRAKVTVNTAPIRHNAAETVTAGGSEGSPLWNPTDQFFVNGGADMENVRFIRSGAVSATIDVEYQGA